METIIIDDKTVSVNGVEYLRKEEPKPVFKVGQWVIAINENRSDCIFKISKIYSTYVNGSDIKQNEDNYSKWTFNSIRLATHSEIEQHLIKVAKEKGFKEGVKYSTICFYEHGSIHKGRGKYEYHESDDYMDMGTDTFRATIYKQGKWAEIIPEKKKLPKTKAEFNTFLGLWANRHTKTTDEFLDNYED